MAQPARIPDTKVECCCVNTIIAEGDRTARLVDMGVDKLVCIHASSSSSIYMWEAPPECHGGGGNTVHGALSKFMLS
jgi:hypothetical protein